MGSYFNSFLTITDEGLDELFDDLADGSIDREDFVRLAGWLKGCIMTLLSESDASLNLLIGLTSPNVNTVQRRLLIHAIMKWSGAVLQCTSDESRVHILIERWAGDNGYQLQLPFMLQAV